MKLRSLAPFYYVMLSACVINAQVFPSSVNHCLKTCNEIWQACVTACGPNIGGCTKCTTMAETCRGLCFQTSTNQPRTSTKKFFREYSTHSRKIQDSVRIDSADTKANRQRVENKSMKLVKQVLPEQWNDILTTNDGPVHAWTEMSKLYSKDI